MITFRLGVDPRDSLLALGLGLLSAASFPPLGLWPLSLVALVLFLRLLRDQTSADARNLGLLYGLAFGLGTMYWLFGIFGLLAIPLVALFAGYFGLLATLIGLTRGQTPFVRAALTALFVVAVEWLRGDAWYLRFPWYTVPHALAQSPGWIAPVHWLGTYGFTYVIWHVAALGAFGKPVWWLAFALLPACSYLLPAVGEPDHRAVLIQAEELPVLEQVINRVPTERVDLAVLPEYAYHSSPESVIDAKRTHSGPGALARNLTCPVVFGAVEGDFWTNDFFNVACIIDQEGKLLGTFPKQRPLPLFMDGKPGDRRPVFPLDQGVLGIAVCYDFDAPVIAGSLVQQGATVLVAPTFDAMSWGVPQHVNHELLLRLRAVENDRWILRAASSGRSEAISPHGIPSTEGIEIGETGFIMVGYSHRNSTPPAVYLSALGPAAAVGTVLFLVMRAVYYLRRRRERGSNEPAPL